MWKERKVLLLLSMARPGLYTGGERSQRTTDATPNHRSCPKRLSYPNNYHGNISTIRNQIFKGEAVS